MNVALPAILVDAVHYLKDVFERLPTLKNRDLAQLLPHNWHPASVIIEPGIPGATVTA